MFDSPEYIFRKKAFAGVDKVFSRRLTWLDDRARKKWDVKTKMFIQSRND